MKTAIILIIIFNFSGLLYAQDTRQPALPTEPTRPVVQGTPERNEFPGAPIFPGFPNRENQHNGTVYEVENYELAISGAYPNGNTRNNTSNTINHAQYILYSNRTAQIKLRFTNGSEYIYHLRNPRAKIETSTGIFRETFDVATQVGREFLLEQYTCELNYNNNTITSFNLINNNRVIVQLTFSKKQ
ncbi:MAG: hypothetical protein LBU88_03855 [Treponema sp.]|jgi:hypothetical protein|nr:hypothetical protein [Treponema sp.]